MSSQIWYSYNSFRRGHSKEWADYNPILEEGEYAIDLDLKKFKIGDGKTHWNDLDFIDFTYGAAMAAGAPTDISGKVDKETGKSLVADTEIAKIHDRGSDNQDLSGLVVKETGKGLSSNDYTTAEKERLAGLSNYTHPSSHPASIITQDESNRFVSDSEKILWNGKQAALGFTPANANDARLSDARTPVAHTHTEGDITNLLNDLSGKEAANSNIQAHIGSAHAPSNAQKNSDITKAEIEGKLTGEISTHTHAGGGGNIGEFTINVQALTSSPTDSQTVYFGMLPKAPTTTANISKIYIRKSCTLKAAEIYCYSGTAGTNENWSLYVRKNNTTDTLIATVGVATSERIFSNAALNVSLVAGDYLEIKAVNPLWATNPLTTIFGGYLYFE